MMLEQIKAMDKPFLTPSEAAAVLGCGANALRSAAKHQVETGNKYLGFPFVRIGTRTLIPRIPFIQFVEGSAEK